MRLKLDENITVVPRVRFSLSATTSIPLPTSSSPADPIPTCSPLPSPASEFWSPSTSDLAIPAPTHRQPSRRDPVAPPRPATGQRRIRASTTGAEPQPRRVGRLQGRDHRKPHSHPLAKVITPDRGAGGHQEAAAVDRAAKFGEGRPWSERPPSSTRCLGARRPTGRSTTSATRPSPTRRSRPWLPGNPSSWRGRRWTPRRPASPRLQRAHQGDQHRLRRTLESAERRISSLGERVSRLESAIGRRVDTRGDRFRMTVGGVTFDRRVEAGEHLHRLLRSWLDDPARTDRRGLVGELAGLEVEGGGVDRQFAEVWLRIPVAGLEERWAAADWPRVEPA